MSSHRNITFRLERWRAISSGILESASGTFLLLIAVRHFQAGANAKALIATGGGAGLLLTPLVVTLVSMFGWRAARAAAGLSALGGMAFLFAAAFPSLPCFVAGSVLGMTCLTACIPLFTQIYQDNYPAHERGRLFSRTTMIRIVATVVFSQLLGWVLSERVNEFQLLLGIFALAAFAAASCLNRCPSGPLHFNGSRHPLQALRYVRTDAVFRRTLISWMLMGFANLMMLPMRVEYLANPRYGLALSVGMIALLTGVIPNLARLVVSPVWGGLFDRLNFFMLRIAINVGFAVGIFAFFMGESTVELILASLLFGAAVGGGDIAWSLWVTKIAPPQRVADYMSIHTFLTGARGLVAPFVSFTLIQSVSMGALGLVSALLIVAASLVLLPEVVVARRGVPNLPFRPPRQPLAPPEP